MSGIPALLYIPREDVTSLQSIFPNLLYEEIERELRNCKGDKDAATAAIRARYPTAVNDSGRLVQNQVGPVYAALPACAATTPVSNGATASVQVVGVLPAQNAPATPSVEILKVVPPVAGQQPYVADCCSAPPMASAPPYEIATLPVASAVEAYSAPYTVMNVEPVPEQYPAQSSFTHSMPAAAMIAPSPTPVSPSTGPSRQQCMSCHQSSMIQAPPNLPVGSIAMKWRCPNCGGQNQMSLTAVTSPSHMPAPVPAPASALAPRPMTLSAPVRQQCPCSNCRNSSTIQIPAGTAVGAFVSWRCPTCQSMNQTVAPAPSPPKVSSGLPAQSTHACGGCRRTSKIGLPTMVTAGTRAVSWKCPFCSRENEVPLSTAGTTTTASGQTLMYEQYNSHQQNHHQAPPQPQQDIRTCVCCHGSFAIKASLGAKKLAWKCPKCHMLNS